MWPYEIYFITLQLQILSYVLLHSDSDCCFPEPPAHFFAGRARLLTPY